MDLSKAFNTVNHELLFVKLYAYCFSKDAIKTIHNNLKGRYQRTKINKVFSFLSEILSAVPKGSALGLLLF